MKSIKDLYVVGFGPSSSHTMGPQKAAARFIEKYPRATSYQVTLFGSLAATGKGHLTDKVIIDAFKPKKVDIIWEPETVLPFHPNALKFEAFNTVNKLSNSQVFYSIGGGTIVEEGEQETSPNVYREKNMNEILACIDKSGKRFWEYVFDNESNDFEEYLRHIWQTMKESVERGLENERVLPGKLHLARKASSIYAKSLNVSGPIKDRNQIFSYALAVAEENASGGVIVTAPTCGSAGVLPSVLYHLQQTYALTESRIIKALATAGLIGMLVKTNASVAGAEVGCQGEIGTACSMASAAAAQLLGGTPSQIEYAAEMGMEHHLGLTCDPVLGLVQIPCIERNAMAAARAQDCAAYALLSDGKHSITFDEVVETMLQTGKDLMASYRETGKGGLARIHKVQGSAD
ncbi:MAG: L-serine ammonia-lyase [Proteobacteria bacterium]|nr:L-serine ammonia-lyase [Pseudomonadota bacterium]